MSSSPHRQDNDTATPSPSIYQMNPATEPSPGTMSSPTPAVTSSPVPIPIIAPAATQTQSSPKSTPTPTPTPYFRPTRIGRAASPPTWACYEQIHDSDSSSDSSEEEEDYNDVKGKGKGKEPEKRKGRRKGRTLRPILSIQKSQGFVWNQDLFVPAYIKDRYIASTSPPSSNPSSRGGVDEFDCVEVVEIRVDGNDRAGLVP